jgi:hypothetical protein
LGGALKALSRQGRVKLSVTLCIAAFAGLAGIAPVAPLAAQALAKVPWAAGEDLQYVVRLAGLERGTGAMQVLGLDSMRGHPTWRLHFNIKGSTPFGTYHVDDSYDSWMDAETFNSLRFEQDLYEGGTKRKRNYDIYPSKSMFHQEGKEERASVPDPLDDASFFFFVRTLPLEVGKEYTFNKYFNPDANPVVIKVLRKDTIDVPAGRFATVVLQPTIKTNGIFSEGGHAEIWLSDDSRRILVQMQTHFAKVISLGLRLKSIGTSAVIPGAAPGKKR